MWSPASMPPPAMTDLISCNPGSGGYVQRSAYPPSVAMTGSQHAMAGYAHAQSYAPSGYYGNGMDYLSTMQLAGMNAKPTNGGLSSYCAMNMNVPGHMTGHVPGHMAGQMGYGGLDGSGYLTRGTMTPAIPDCMDTKEWAKFQPI